MILMSFCSKFIRVYTCQ